MSFFAASAPSTAWPSAGLAIAAAANQAAHAPLHTGLHAPAADPPARRPPMQGYPSQPQLAASWWQAVRQLERTLATAGPENHGNLDLMERWLTSGDKRSALVALSTVARLQPLFLRSAEGRAWANALRQAGMAWASVPAATASDPGRLEAHLRRHPHLLLALQQPRFVRQTQQAMASTARARQRPHGSPGGMEERFGRSPRDYAHASGASHPSLRKPVGEKHTLAPSGAGLGRSCYEEISHRQTFGRWMSHHVAPGSDCSVHGVPSCGQAYAIELAQQLVTRPAVARLLPGHAAEETGYPEAQSLWTSRDRALHEVVESLSEIDAPRQLFAIVPLDQPPAAARATLSLSSRFASAQSTQAPAVATLPSVVRTAQDLRETLSAAIQEHVQPGCLPDPARPLSDFLPPPLADQYAQIMARMQVHTQTSNEYGERQRIDIYADPLLADGIEEWMAGVGDWLSLAADAPQRIELEGLSSLHFLTHADYLNDLSLRADIEEMQSSGELRLYHEAVQDLSDRYGIPARRSRELVKQLNTIDYTLRTLFQTVRDVGLSGNLNEQKVRMLGITCSLVIQGALRGVAPVFYQDVNQNNEFNLVAYYEYYGAFMLANLFGAQAESGMETALVGLEKWLNYQLLYCVFYGEPPKDDFNTLYNALLRGRDGGGQLIDKGLNEGLPDLGTLLVSTGAMTYLDYRLGLLNLVFLPLTYLWAKQQNNRLQSLHKQGVKEIDRSARAIHALIDAAADLRALAGLPAGFEATVKQLATERGLVHAKGRKQIWANYLTFLPMAAAGLLSVGVADAAGLPFGTVLASSVAAAGMHYPLQRLIKLVFNTSPPLLLDFKSMQTKLSDVDSFDLPGGPIDEARTPISALPDLRIVFSDLHYSVAKRGGTAEQVLTEPPVKRILRGLNLVIEPGELVSLVGASGSGKTTLIQLLAGVNVPTAGELTIGGVARQDIRKYGDDSVLNTIHYSTQHPKFFPSMTVLENLLFGLPECYDNEEDTAKAHAIVEGLLVRLHFDPEFDLHAKYTPKLSGGEHARLGIIRAVLPILMSHRGILIADEPTAPLDQKSEENNTPGCAEAVIGLLQEVAAMGATVICVTHDPKLSAVSRVVKMGEINPHAETTVSPCR